MCAKYTRIDEPFDHYTEGDEGVVCCSGQMIVNGERRMVIHVKWEDKEPSDSSYAYPSHLDMVQAAPASTPADWMKVARILNEADDKIEEIGKTGNAKIDGQIAALRQALTALSVGTAMGGMLGRFTQADDPQETAPSRLQSGPSRLESVSDDPSRQLQPE